MRTRFQVSSHLAVTKCRIIDDSHSWLFKFNFHVLFLTFSTNSTPTNFNFQSCNFISFLSANKTKKLFVRTFHHQTQWDEINPPSIIVSIFEANQSKKLSFFLKESQNLSKSEVWWLLWWRLWSSCCRVAIPNCLFIHECPLIKESSLTDDDRPNPPKFFMFRLSPADTFNQGEQHFHFFFKLFSYLPFS